MPNVSIEEWTKLNQDNLEAIKQFSENYTRAMTYLTQQQMEMVSLYMEASAKQLEELSQAKSVSDFMATQSRLSAALNDKLVKETQQKLVEMFSNFTKVFYSDGHDGPP